MNVTDLLARTAALLAATPGDAPPPAFLPGQLIEVLAYDGKPREELAEVYKVRWNYDRGDWCYHVRCFAPEGAEPKYRNFWARLLQAD